MLAVAAIAVLGLAGCGEATEKRAATPVMSASDGAHPVRDQKTQPAEGATPRSRTTSPAPKAQRPKPARTTVESGGAGSGDMGLDRFVAAVQRQLPAVAVDRRDEEVEDLGVQACQGLEAGERDAVVAGVISEQGVDLGDARKLVALARSTACGDRPKV
ncbi:DUF732 domain-containing protein [Actinoplanes sp. CA-142083]|uniref:DUF732 domain-containing protein n=1 Tax=Actinoplanes sp. CA-142083 TaxID=3239903 RepID=UPI003D92B27E